MINNDLVLDSKIGNEVQMHLTQHITQKRKKQHNVHYIVFIDMTQNVIFYAPLTTLHCISKTS